MQQIKNEIEGDSIFRLHYLLWRAGDFDPIFNRIYKNEEYKNNHGKYDSLAKQALLRSAAARDNRYIHPIAVKNSEDLYKGGGITNYKEAVRRLLAKKNSDFVWSRNR